MCFSMRTHFRRLLVGSESAPSTTRCFKAHWLAVEGYPGELETLRADNARLRRLLDLAEQQARAADSDQTATGTSVDMRSSSEDKVRFYLDLFPVPP